MSEGERKRFRVPPAGAGERLDRFVTDHVEAARNQVQQWIEAGRIEVDGEDAKASTRLREGQVVDVRTPPPRDPRIEPEEGPIAVLHEDEDLIALNKPAGLVVHPGAGRRTGTLAHRLLAHYPELAGVGGPGRPGIVHRLDMDTSGVMVVARTERGYQGLIRAFSGRTVEKRYLGILYGDPGEELRIEAPIGRHPTRRKRMTVRERGRPALSVFRRLETIGSVSRTEIEIETGRTHQIRVHAKHAGYPLVGDPVYGEARWKPLPPRLHGPLRSFPRPALHAWRLSLDHPVTGEKLDFVAPPPEDLTSLWEALTKN